MALGTSGLLATTLRGTFDSVAKRVADAFDCPMAEVLLVQRDAELLHGSATAVGGDREEAPAHSAERSLSIASHVVASGKPLVVPDLWRDARYASHPGLNQRGVRFFAAAPLLNEQGHALGALCVMDVDARQLNQRDVMLLENLAADVVATAQRERNQRAHATAPVDAASTAAAASIAASGQGPEKPATA